MTQKADYSEEDIVKSLKGCGVMEGDILFCHISLGRLGRPACAPEIESICGMVLRSIRRVLGATGTLLVPSYTYSLGKNEPFDVDKTPSTIGPFPEYFRKQKGVIRSADPMLAVCGLGPTANDLFTNLPQDCYGTDSLYHRLRLAEGKVCTIGLELWWATFIHHVEEAAEVPFRFTKPMSTLVTHHGKTECQTWNYFAAFRSKNCRSTVWNLQRILRETGEAKVHPLGRSELWCIAAADYYNRGLEEMGKNPWITAAGPPVERDELLSLEDVQAKAVRES